MSSTAMFWSGALGIDGLSPKKWKLITKFVIHLICSEIGEPCNFCNYMEEPKSINVEEGEIDFLC